MHSKEDWWANITESVTDSLILWWAEVLFVRTFVNIRKMHSKEDWWPPHCAFYEHLKGSSAFIIN